MKRTVASTRVSVQCVNEEETKFNAKSNIPSCLSYRKGKHTGGKEIEHHHFIDTEMNPVNLHEHRALKRNITFAALFSAT